jgi:hypothetical protein
MKKTWRDRFSDVMLMALRPIGFVWMRLDAQKKITSTVDFHRKDPFLLLGNHTYTLDVVQLALPFRQTPAIISQEFLLSARGLRWLLKHVAKVIPKSKGTADVRTIKSILTYVKKGYPVMIMPEGDTTFFGRTGLIEPATAKLVKKLELDVVIAKTKGGYLSKPRWATGRRRGRYIEIHYDTLYTADQVRTLTVEQIEQGLINALDHDDYVWQDSVKHLYQGDRLAEGFDNVIYRCPECGAFHSFVVEGNEIRCRTCDTAGTMNDYGFIEGFSYRTVYEFDQAQRAFDDDLKQQTFQSSATLQFVDHDKRKRTPRILVQVAYQAGEIHIKHKTVETIPVAEMGNPVITMRRNLTFDYQNKVYLIKLERYAMSFLRAVQSKY